MCKDEIMDEELTGMVNYTDETVPAEMPCMDRKTQRNSNARKGDKRVAVNCHDCPFAKKRNLLDRLRDMAKWLGICGGICMLLWWFEVNGLMAMDAAYPCIFASGCIGFFGGGVNYAK